MALFYWGLTPEYINAHWTEELLGLMFAKLEGRIRLSLGDDGLSESPAAAGVPGLAPLGGLGVERHD